MRLNSPLFFHSHQDSDEMKSARPQVEQSQIVGWARSSAVERPLCKIKKSTRAGGLGFKTVSVHAQQ